MRRKLPCVASIAGSDSSSGAGIQADIKTISATGAYAATIITALTAQNTQGVQAIKEISADFVQQQIKSVFSDLPVSVVKIGMLHNKRVIKIVADALNQYKPNHVVVDPVMYAKNGCELLQSDTIHYLQETLFPLATLITPNAPEAEKLLAIKIENTADQMAAAKMLAQRFKLDVLLKGGHLINDTSSDVLYSYQENKYSWFHSPRIISKNTHGTGCSLSSAIASYLAQDYSLSIAVTAAKEFISKAILYGRDLQLGAGCGPIDHFYILRNFNDS